MLSNVLNSEQQSLPGTSATSGPPLVEQGWRLIVEHKWVVLGIIAAAVLVGVVVTMLATPQYTSTSRVEISRDAGNVTDVEGVDETDRSTDLEFYDTQYSLLQARSLAERVVRDLNLSADDEFFNSFGLDPDSNGLLASDQPTVQDAQGRTRRFKVATEVLLENVAIIPIRGSSLVDISFTSPDRQLSANIANSWVEQFIESNIARRFSSTKDARDFLETRLADLRQKLEDSERQLVAYASEKQIVSLSTYQDIEGNTTTQETLVSSDLQVMNAQLAQARAERIAAQSAAQQGRGAQAALVNPALNGMRQSRAEVAAERARLLSTFEPEYPDVKALTSQLAELDRSISREEARIRSASNSSFNEALAKERELASQVAGLKGRLSNQNSDSIEYNIYQREVDTTRELYDGLLQRYKEIGVAGIGANNVAVVDRARISEIPSSPSLPLNVALSTLLGMVLAAGYLFVREQVDQSLRDPADVNRLLNIPQLGTVPKIVSTDIHDELRDPKSVTSEAYFSIRTNLSFLTETGVPQSIMFTSTQPNEGKTTSTYATAIALARNGTRVLLIDADMRNSSLHREFETDRDTGLSNYLSGDRGTENLVRSTHSDSLKFMTAGPTPPNPAELLTGGGIQRLIAEFSDQFDHFVFDGPPVLGIADAPLLANGVDGVIFTIEANGAKLRAVQMALQRLRAANAHLFGAIVTKVDSRNSSYGYGQDYGYGYSYGGSSQDADR